MAAHELRNPIQPIIGFSELLYSKIEDQEQRHLLDQVMLNARRLERLAEIMLDVTRIEKNSLVLKKEIIDISEMLKDIVERYNHNLEERKVRSKEQEVWRLRVIYEGIKSIKVTLDKVRITQVICNILDNAIRFSPEGQICVKLKKKRQDGQNLLVISVKDMGRGIDPEILSKLFTKFVSKSATGIGLGLFISKGILRHTGEDGPKIIWRGVLHLASSSQ